MKKFRVMGIGYYDCIVEVEAETAEEAVDLAAETMYPSLCHQCGDRVQLGDIEKFEVEDITND